VVLVTAALVRGALRVHGPQRAVLAAFGGMWIGYLLQSLISFDMPPLALLGYLSAGMVLALGAPPSWRTVTLPGRPPEPKLNKRGRPVGPTVVPTSSKVLAGATCLVGLVLAWLAAYPLRADVAAAAAAPLTQSGRLAEAVEKFERAASLNPSEASYTFLLTQVKVAMGDVDGGLAAAEESIRRDPGTVQYPLFAARQAKEAGRLEESLRWYELTVQIDPLDPPILNETAVELLERNQPDRAAMLLETSVEVLPDAESLVLLGQARVALEDVAGARAAFERALELAPEDPKALEQLALLPAAA
jgi:tetratricopeptide (TPR) repeat protein